MYKESENSEEGKDGDIESEEHFVAHKAAAAGDVETLIKVIQDDPSLLEHQDSEGHTLLGNAVKAQQLEVVKLLVKMGANINAQDNQGRTPVAIAAYQGWYNGVVFLLRNGANQNICDKSGRLPLHTSSYDKDIKTMSILLQNLTVEEVNKPDNEEMTVLHWAAFHGRPKHIELLLEVGADIFARDIDKKTPLHWSAQNGCISCCKVFAGCSRAMILINLVDQSGKTPIHFAAAAGHAEVIEELNKIKGCVLECDDPDKRKPLHWAAAMGHPQCVKILLKLGVSVNPVDSEKCTPLNYAIRSGHSVCQKLLQEESDLIAIQKCSSLPQSQSSVLQKPILFIRSLFQSKTNADNSDSKPSVHKKNLVELEEAWPSSKSSRCTDLFVDAISSQKSENLKVPTFSIGTVSEPSTTVLQTHSSNFSIINTSSNSAIDEKIHQDSLTSLLHKKSTVPLSDDTILTAKVEGLDFEDLTDTDSSQTQTSTSSSSTN